MDIEEVNYMVFANRALVTIAVLFAAVVSVCMTFSDVADAKERPRDGLWVTFDVGGERFRAVVTRPESIDYVLGYVQGSEPQRVPNGEVVAGGQYNAPWSWSLTPESVEFGDSTMEMCDATPSMVDANVDEWIKTVQRFCPWSARITKVRDCRSGQNCKPLRGLYAGRSPAF